MCSSRRRNDYQDTPKKLYTLITYVPVATFTNLQTEFLMMITIKINEFNTTYQKAFKRKIVVHVACRVPMASKKELLNFV